MTEAEYMTQLEDAEARQRFTEAVEWELTQDPAALAVRLLIGLTEEPYLGSSEHEALMVLVAEMARDAVRGREVRVPDDWKSSALALWSRLLANEIEAELHRIEEVYTK